MTATVLSNIQMNPTDGLSPVLVRSTTKLASGRPRVIQAVRRRKGHGDAAFQELGK